MKCTRCRQGQTEPGRVTVTLERDGTMIVVRDVPAEVCEICAEYYLDSDTAARLYAQAEGAVQRHAEVEIVRYAA